MTPRAHMSAGMPWYCSPDRISGAATGAPGQGSFSARVVHASCDCRPLHRSAAVTAASPRWAAPQSTHP